MNLPELSYTMWLSALFSTEATIVFGPGVDAFENETAIRFRIFRDLEALEPSTYTQTLDYHTQDGTALANVDYVPTKGAVIFTIGQSEVTVEVPLLDNAFLGDNKFFTLVTTNLTPDGAVPRIPPPTGIGWRWWILSGRIKDNELPENRTPEFRVSSRRVHRESRSVRLSVVRTGETSQAASVDCQTADDSGKAGADYISQTGRLTFKPLEVSKFVSVPLLTSNSDFTFVLRLSHPSVGYTNDSPALVRVLPEVRLAITTNSDPSTEISPMSEAGIVYTLESSIDFLRWQGVTSTRGDGGMISLFDARGAEQFQFYRIRAE